jgi:hypothetical protein
MKLEGELFVKRKGTRRKGRGTEKGMGAND